MTSSDANPPARARLKSQIGWVSYDFANTIFSMNIVTFYFAPWIILDLGVEDIWYSLSYSVSMLLVAMTMPVLGGRVDQHGGKLSMMKRFTLGCVTATVVLGAVAILDLSPLLTAAVTLLCFCVANYFYEGGIAFYNTLLSDVSTPDNVGRLSGLGVGAGYAGAILGLLMLMPITEGKLIPGVSGREYAFLPTAALFLLFALPAFLWIRERQPMAGASHHHSEHFFKRLLTSLRETRNYPGALRFLIADYLVEDAIATTIVFMAVYAEAVVGFQDQDKIVLFVTSTTCALLGSLLFGWLVDRFRAKPALLTALVGWVGVLAVGVIASEKASFFIIGGFVGVFLGAVWTSARPLLNSLVPQEKLGQFYGLYALSGRAAATIGPLLWGLVVLLGKQDAPLGQLALNLLAALGVDVSTQLADTIHYRLALASLLVTLAAGLILFFKVPNRRRYEPAPPSV